MGSTENVFIADGAEGVSDLSAPMRRSIDAPATISAAGAWPIRVAIVQARSALISMRLDEASKAISKLNRLLSVCRHSEFLRYSPALRTLRASRLALEEDFAGARSMLATLPARAGHTIAATIHRYADWRSGECEVSAPDTVDYLASPVGGKAIDRIYSLCISAAFAFDRLHLTLSASLATEALHLARRRYGNHSPLGSFPATLLGQVAYEQGRLEEAEALLRPRMSVIRASGMPEYVLRASVLLARISLHRGRHACALASLRDAEALGRARRWPGLLSGASSEYARAVQAIRCRDGGTLELRTATKCDTIHDAPGSDGPHTTHDSARSQALTGRNFPIRRLIARCRIVPMPLNAPLKFSSIEGVLQRACSAAADGRIDDSYGLLIECLRTGARHGLHMIFIDAGPQILPLLAGLYHAIPASDPQLADLRPYIATLLKSRTQMVTEEAGPTAYRSLSPREAGVLQMIARGMSNKRIAQSLGITPETVKTHAKSIFSKLETRTRAQAVARAESIGLL